MCRRCSTDQDCGADGICVGGTCQTPCGPEPERSCPGDSTCFNTMAAGSVASSGACTNTPDCDPGEQCFPDGDGGGKCATPCRSNSGCTGDQRCLGLGQKFCVDTFPRCLNPSASSKGVCHQSYACTGGAQNPCTGVACPGGQTCHAGQCIDPPDLTVDAGGPHDTGSPTKDAGPPDISSDITEPDLDVENPDLPDSQASTDIQDTPGPNPGHKDKPLDPAQADGPPHIFLRAEGCACTSTPTENEIPAEWLLLSAAGLAVVWRRER